MNCQKVSQRLAEYIINEISHEESVKISKHLDNCQNCSLERDELQQLLGFIDETQVEAPGDLFFSNIKSSVMAEIQAEQTGAPAISPKATPSGFFNKFLKWLNSGYRRTALATVCAGALLLVLFLTVPWFRDLSDPIPSANPVQVAQLCSQSAMNRGYKLAASVDEDPPIDSHRIQLAELDSESYDAIGAFFAGPMIVEDENWSPYEDEYPEELELLNEAEDGDDDYRFYGEVSTGLYELSLDELEELDRVVSQYKKG